MQLPWGSESDLIGIVDLIEMKAIRYLDDLGKDQEIVDIPAELAEKADAAREALIDAVATFDDDLAETYLETGEVDSEQLKAAIRKATLALEINPVLCGSAFKNKGVQPLLDAVLDYLPSPLDVPPVTGVVDVKGSDEVRRGDPRDQRLRAVRRAGLQDHGRPVRRQADLLPRLLGQARGGLAASSTSPRATASGSAAS